MILEKKYFVITGASRGIGLAVAELAAQKKAHLILVNRSENIDLKQKLLALGAPSVEILTVDLSRSSDVDYLCADLQKRQIDLVFNNAGLLTGGLIEEQPLADIHQMLFVNVNALIQISRAVLPQMLKQKSGKIINHGSVSSIMHLPCASTYAASKAAVWAFTNCLEQEIKNTGVSTLCLLTPGVKTDMFNHIETLYSKNVKTPKDSISPNDYAKLIVKAIEDDQTVLFPTGATGIGLFLAIHFRVMFQWLARFSFKGRATGNP